MSFYGWRGKIGHVFPARVYDSTANELHQMAPEGVLVGATSLNIQKLVSEEFEKALLGYEDAAKALAFENYQCIIIGGDPIITRQGPGFDKELIERIENIVQIPVTTTITASMDALRELKAKKIAVAAPYAEEISKRLIDFLEANDFEIVSTHLEGITNNYELAEMPFNASYEYARLAVKDRDDVDAIYLPCARWPVTNNINWMEEDFQIPVVGSAQSMMWWGLKTIGVGLPLNGYGKLLQMK